MARQAGKDVTAAVREVCLSLPEAEEFVSHGAPNFRVRRRTFATYAVNVHGDGRVALWLAAPEGAQEHHLRASAKHFFVPPYVGVRGWIGVRLDAGLSWRRIAALVREAYERVAPPALVRALDETIEIEPPTRALAPADVDRLKSPHALAVLERLRALCLELPETRESRQFGSPVWQAGPKTFAVAYDYGQGLRLGFWVGIEAQGLYVEDPRYTIPPYMGHHGWIALDASRTIDWAEVGRLARASYRRFALKRMLAALDE